jgi:hypothetical protein
VVLAQEIDVILLAPLGSYVQLDASSLRTMTDSNGIARLNLTIVRGASGNVTVAFFSEAVLSALTSPAALRSSAISLGVRSAAFAQARAMDDESGFASQVQQFVQMQVEAQLRSQGLAATQGAQDCFVATPTAQRAACLQPRANEGGSNAGASALDTSALMTSLIVSLLPEFGQTLLDVFGQGTNGSALSLEQRVLVQARRLLNALPLPELITLFVDNEIKSAQSFAPIVGYGLPLSKPNPIGTPSSCAINGYARYVSSFGPMGDWFEGVGSKGVLAQPTQRCVPLRRVLPAPPPASVLTSCRSCASPRQRSTALAAVAVLFCELSRRFGL